MPQIARLRPMRPHTLAVLTAAAALTLTACSSTGEADTMPTTTATTPATTTAIDRTADLTAANPDAPWLATLTTATETEPGRVEVATTITDPRGDNGSPEAQEAIAVCQATVALLGDTAVYVRVLESDGTSFVLYSVDALPMDLPSNECVEA